MLEISRHQIKLADKMETNHNDGKSRRALLRNEAAAAVKKEEPEKPSSAKMPDLVPSESKIKSSESSGVSKEPTSSLSIKEATVVLALVELAEPVTVQAQIASI